MGKIIIKGNASKTLELQPGWTIENDGRGLLTSRLTFVCDAEVVEAKKPKENEAHPKNGKLLCHKSSYTVNDNGVAIINADYVGIETGQITKLEITGDVALNTAPIQAHPKFYKGTAGDTGKALKDLGWDASTKSFPETDAEAVDKALVGITSFLAPDIQVTGTYYTSSAEYLRDNQKMVGKTFAKIVGAESMIVPTIMTALSKYHTRAALMTGCAYEQYANIYKVRFTIRVSQAGWHGLVYEAHN
jgi:hypothetical protein